MKKIVMGLAALSMAASMFAADISAGTKIKGSLFGLDKDGKITALQQANDSHDYANPNFVLSVSGEKAGADLKITTDGATKTTAQTTQTIWFKPFDVLKVTVGNYDVALNKETIDWTESYTGLGGQGFLTQLTIEGFSLDLGMNPGEGNWLAKAKGADAVLANTFVKVGYSADFGNIGAYVALNKAYPVNPWDGGYGINGLDKKAATETLQNMDFGAGYKNTFGPVTCFAQVVGHMEAKMEYVRPEVFVSGNADAFGYNLFVAPLIWTNSDLNQKTQMEVVAKVSYGINGVTPYIYFKDANILASTFTSTIKVGCTGNLGPMGWNVWAEIGTGEKTTFSVPFELSVNF